MHRIKMKETHREIPVKMGMKISQMVEKTETDSEQHVDDSKDNGHLHLERVQKCQLVAGNVPYLREEMVKDGASV